MEKVVVYVIPDHKESKLDRNNVVASYFDHEDFLVILHNPSLLGLPASNPNYPQEKRWEYFRVLSALLNAQKDHQDKWIIVIKDTSISVADPFTIANYISYLMSPAAPKTDIIYLSRWGDKCQLLTDRKEIVGSNGVFLARSQSPNGVQAILFSPSGRDILIGSKPMKNGQMIQNHRPLGEQLNNEISSGNIMAHIISPNLFLFSNTYAVNNNEFMKCNECTRIENISNSEDDKSYIIWIVIIIAILILLIAIAIIIARRRKN